MVLICADPSEVVAAFLCSRLRILQIEHRILDLRAAHDLRVLAWPSSSRSSGAISCADWKLNLDELTGVYFRSVPVDEAEQVERSDSVPYVYPRIDPRIAGLLNSLPCRVVNRPSSTYSNRSKPYQALIIRHCGLSTPKTLITNDPAATRRFYADCNGELISKSISGAQSTVRRISEADLERLPGLPHRPAQLQEYLPGDNIRVHVIGERLFPVRIQSRALDYRYAGREGYARTMLPAILPETVAGNCLRVTKELGLTMSGIDLKETPSGEYYCFEVNTSPAFTFYESPARPIVADALAEFLAQRNA